MDAWILNLDADLELAAGLGYAPRKSVQDAMKHHAIALAKAVVREEDVIVDDATPVGSAHGFVGRAFCPTPRALAMLRRAGAAVEAHPSFDVLRRVNARAFCQELGTTLRGASFDRDLAQARAKIDSTPPMGIGWRVKRSFGFAGRGQRVVRSGEDVAFLKTWIDEGGVQIEPNVEIVREYAMHGMLAKDGTSSLGVLVTQTCDASGAWLSSERAKSAEVERAMVDQMDLVGRALHDAGYFGPFAIDAFEYRDADEVRLQPRSEINARYTMGFSTGFAVVSRP